MFHASYRQPVRLSTTYHVSVRTAQVHRTPLSEREAGVQAGDVAATEGARRATGGAATSLAATRGYPWPVLKLRCFGQRSWHELTACIKDLVPRPRCSAPRPKAKGVGSLSDAGPARPASPRRPAGRSTQRLSTGGLVGRERARATPSSWALAAEMERYLAAHNAPPNGKTVRRVRP